METPEFESSTRRPATIPMGTSRGKVTSTIVEIVNARGEIVAYGCADCSKTFPTYGGAFGHRGSHFPRVSVATTSTNVPAVVQSIQALVKENKGLARQVEGLESRLKSEKSKRQKVERRLQQIERLFAPR